MMTRRPPFGPTIGALIVVVGPRRAHYLVPWHEVKRFRADRGAMGGRRWLPETRRELARNARAAGGRGPR